MSLAILYSDRIEDLAEDLKKKLLAARTKEGADPFAFSQVVVPNANIAKWLQMRQFAPEEKLCAGIEFPFMEQRLTELMRANLEKPEEFELLPDHAYAHAIMRILLTNGADALKPFRAYIDGGTGALPLRIDKQKQAQMAWQLADTLANLMDTYEVRRPEIVENWIAGGRAKDKNTPPQGTEAGEAELAKALWGKNGAFPEDGNRLSLRQLYNRVKEHTPKGPAQTIYFFGQSTLTLLQVRILAWLAQTHDVVFYHNNPCREYWGDIETAKERRKAMFGVSSAVGERNPDADFDWNVGDSTVENSLLAKFGIAGRETIRLLVDLEEESAGGIDFEWLPIGAGRGEGEKVLEKVQAGIRNRTSDLEKVKQDASIQIVGTPGIRREVEMVYNSILGSVWQPEGSGKRPWPKCSFSDIAVLVTDMATYRPVLEAVFDARGQVPYGLIDTTASEDSQYLAGFLALAELARKGLTRETLFAVLENPCVQAALDFTREDVVEWRELTEALGAFDGFERKRDDDYFCWEWALSRLRLGRVADSLGVTADKVGATLPLVMRGGDSALHLSEIVERLSRELLEVAQDRLPCSAPVVRGSEKHGASNWAWALGRLANEFLSVPKDDPLEANVRKDVLRTLNGLMDVGEQTYEFPVAAVEHFVGGISCRKGGYLTHGVTIAGLRPMRPVPFKQVYVLGLGAGGFPGRTSSSTLDIRGTGWRLGDVSIPDTNRFLFLETLMAVRDRLVISYPNRDIEKDAELFPSSVVLELESFIGNHVVNDMGGEDGRQPIGFREFKGYPLLEHGEDQHGTNVMQAYKDATADVEWADGDRDAGILSTYSAPARALANERRRGGSLDVPHAHAAEGTPSEEVTAKELADFIRNPLRAVMQHRFGIEVEGYRDQDLEPDSPLDIPGGPPLWNLQRRLFLESVKARKEKLDQETTRCRLDACYRELQLSGGAPSGIIGDFAIERVRGGLDSAMDALVNFAQGFELAGIDGGGARTGVMEARSSMSIASSAQDGGSRTVTVTGTARNWKEEDGMASVLVLGRIGDKRPVLPPDCTLEPLLAFLMKIAEDGDDAAERAVKVGVVDIGSGLCGDWEWKATPAKARDFISRLVVRYLSYLNQKENDGRLPLFDYWKVKSKLEEWHCPNPPDFQSLADALADDGFKPGKKTFNNALVVEKVLEPHTRMPTAEELREMFADFYRYLLGEGLFVVQGASHGKETAQ